MKWKEEEKRREKTALYSSGYDMSREYVVIKEWKKKKEMKGEKRRRRDIQVSFYRRELMEEERRVRVRVKRREKTVGDGHSNAVRGNSFSMLFLVSRP